MAFYKLTLVQEIFAGTLVCVTQKIKVLFNFERYYDILVYFYIRYTYSNMYKSKQINLSTFILLFKELAIIQFCSQYHKILTWIWKNARQNGNELVIETCSRILVYLKHLRGLNVSIIFHIWPLLHYVVGKDGLVLLSRQNGPTINEARLSSQDSKQQFLIHTRKFPCSLEPCFQ